MDCQLIAIFTFQSPETADHALCQLWSSMDRGFHRSGGGEIWIYGNCLNPRLASQICIACGGHAR